ncbi:methylated-DNA--[protein]-cysteine S-methyltransferase [Pseudonocardia acaciae]|uniref:methylated-DNA--[protein]-cysteine S-methyltransferase n=1 Tax=Pseudonocardia acaciae TaxID=551276 RepID=UPI00056B0F37|nr:methylated-DNA--[protein]-cysteine S-methyltransferase [Pseudonocardia acaciae]
MMSMEHELAGLVVDPPAGLLDRVVARWVRVPGPLGELYAAVTDAGLAYLRPGPDPAAFAEEFRERFGRPLLPGERPPAGLLPALRPDGPGGRAVKVDLRGLTDFERDVLGATRRIPAGQTRPYAWVAREIGRPKAVRAVGSALGRNPVPIVIPCHRVTRSDGDPGGYVFGAPAKERLLRAERVNLDEVRELARARVHYLGSDTTGIVCYPTCADARRIGPAHRVGFRDMAAAAKDGYRPCQKCRPGAA